MDQRPEPERQRRADEQCERDRGDHPALDTNRVSKASDKRRLRRTGQHRLDSLKRLGDGLHGFDAEPGGPGWQRFDRVAPYEDGTRFRLGDHLEAVFRAVIDDNVHVQRRGGEPPRAAQDEHRGKLEAVRLEPALRLQLRNLAFRVRALRQEHHLELVLTAQRRNLRDRSRLDLFQRAPEVFDRRDPLPDLPQLPAGQDTLLLNG